VAFAALVGWCAGTCTWLHREGTERAVDRRLQGLV